MHWMWIDRIVELRQGESILAIKGVSLAEDHLYDHFAKGDGGPLADPVMPASLVVEGMAQTAGVLVGHARNFREKVILAKVNRAEIALDARPGQTIRFWARLDRIDDAGASTTGTVEILDHASGSVLPAGRIDIVFSHIDRNRAGLEFPDENFVFCDDFRTLLRISDIEADF